MRFVFTSDFHLNKLERFFENHLELQRIEMRKPFLYALENGIEHVWIGGDISEDPTLDGPALTSFIRLLTEFDGRLNIHIVLGNHDFAHVEEHSLQSIAVLCEKQKFSTVRIYEKPAHVQIDGMHFNALPYPYAVPDKVYTKKPTINVAHIEWAGALRDNGKSKIKDGYTDGDKGKDVWCIGHLHTPQWLKKPRVLYCGTLYQTNFGETADKSWCDCIATYKNGELQFKYKRVPSRCAFILENLRITSNKDFDKLEKNPLHLYKLWLSADVKLPKQLTIDYPNIISTAGEGAQATEEEVKQVQVDVSLDKKKAMFTLLKQQGLTKEQIKRAPNILKQVGVQI